MTEIRLYLPGTADDLDALLRDGRLEVAGRTAYGVSPGLVAATPRADEEEREYAAFLEAADAAGAADGGAGRVVVLSIDLPEPEISWPQEGHFVTLSGAIARRDLVAIHLGEEPGPDADLLWYDATEAAAVVELLRG